MRYVSLFLIFFLFNNIDVVFVKRLVLILSILLRKKLEKVLNYFYLKLIYFNFNYKFCVLLERFIS